MSMCFCLQEIVAWAGACIYGEQRERETVIVQKRSTYKCMYGETYIVCVIGSKSVCKKEKLTEKLQIETEIEMLARGTSASLSVGDDQRVVQRVKLCVCERKIKGGHLTASREKHM